MRYDEIEICKRYLNLENATNIAKSLGTYNTTIRRILIRNNIKLRGNSEIFSVVKHNPFINLNCRDTMYFLGLLAADGNVSIANSKYRILLSLHEKDIFLLEQYANFISKELKVKNYNNNTYNIKEYYVSFCNKNTALYLNSLGITPNKSKTLNINFEITWDFLRGVIDGDGYIKMLKNRSQIEIASASEKFTEQLSNFLIKNQIHHTINKKGSCNIIGIYKNKDCFECFTNLYNNANIFMKRKYLKFGPYIEQSILANSPKTVNVSVN